jgi:hypothetical protein
MTATPVWLLDVDGVVNANRPGWSEAPYSGQMFARGQWWPFRWSPSLVGFIRRIVESERAEVRWATTWNEHARELEALFRLPRLPVAFPEPQGDDFPAGKLQAALRVVEEEQRSLVWTDDDAIPAVGPFRARLDAAEHGFLPISPRPNRGLRPEHASAIEEFLHR